MICGKRSNPRQRWYSLHRIHHRRLDQSHLNAPSNGNNRIKLWNDVLFMSLEWQSKFSRKISYTGQFEWYKKKSNSGSEQFIGHLNAMHLPPALMHCGYLFRSNLLVWPSGVWLVDSLHGSLSTSFKNGESISKYFDSTYKQNRCRSMPLPHIASW